MKCVMLICLSYLASQVTASREKKIEYKSGKCEPFTIDLIASLAYKEFKSLVDPSKRQVSKTVRFELYTRRNPLVKQSLTIGRDRQLNESHFNTKWPVRFIIHGWYGRPTSCSVAAIKDAYLAKGDYNVILVDWSDYALDVNYYRTIQAMPQVAKRLNAFARFLNKAAGIQFREIYLVTHSMSCHLAGIAGKLLKPDTYGVIFALDPAGPVFKKSLANARLTSADALYVESIQTDVLNFGFDSDQLADASFFPNWGLGQPHCPNSTISEPDLACDHFGALYYFVESLRNGNAFGSIKCKSYRHLQRFECSCGASLCSPQAFMGGDPATPKKGVFYVSTKSTEPFGYGQMCHMKKPLAPTLLRTTPT